MFTVAPEKSTTFGSCLYLLLGYGRFGIQAFWKGCTYSNGTETSWNWHILLTNFLSKFFYTQLRDNCGMVVSTSLAECLSLVGSQFLAVHSI